MKKTKKLQSKNVYEPTFCRSISKNCLIKILNSCVENLVWSSGFIIVSRFSWNLKILWDECSKNLQIEKFQSSLTCSRIVKSGSDSICILILHISTMREHFFKTNFQKYHLGANYLFFDVLYYVKIGANLPPKNLIMDKTNYVLSNQYIPHKPKMGGGAWRGLGPSQIF